MAVQAIEPTTYPLSAATAEALRRPLFGHYIEGRAVPSADGATMPVIDPASGAQIAVAAAGSQADVDAAVRSARAAFDDGRWRRLAPHRARADAAPVGRPASRRTGDLRRPGHARCRHPARVRRRSSSTSPSERVELLRRLAYQAGGLDPGGCATARRVVVSRSRIGVVAIIVPWNGPTAVIAFVAAALAAGNSVVLKPAPQTPTLGPRPRADSALEAGIPDWRRQRRSRVAARRGSGLVTHPDVDKISFTGSVRTGKAIAGGGGRAAEEGQPRARRARAPSSSSRTPTSRAAAAGAMSAVWSNSGQVCTAGTRTSCTAASTTRSSTRSSPLEGPARRFGLRREDRDGAAHLRRAARRGRALRRDRRGGGRQPRPRRLARRRRGLPARAHDLHRRTQGHAHRPGGDLRAR